MRFRIVVHGDRANLPVISEVVDLLRARDDVHIDVRPTWEAGDSLAIAAEAAALGVDRIVAAGGDGMIHQVVNGLHHLPERPIVGVLPLGTANDFATTAGLVGLTTPELVSVLCGPAIPIDLIRVGDSCFANVAVGGFAVNDDINEGLKRTLGGFAYFVAGVAKLGNPDLTPLTVRGPDFEWEDEVHGFAVANARTAGGGNQLADTALVDDGQLDFVALPSGVRITQAAQVESGFKVRPVEEHVQRYRSPWVEIESPAPLRLHLDGEPYHIEGCVRFEVLPAHVRFALPQDSPMLTASI